MRNIAIGLLATLMLYPDYANAEFCRMGKNSYSEKTIVCECPQLIKKDENTYEILSRRLICGKDGAEWNVLRDGNSETCFIITELALTAQLNNLNRLSQSMPGCSP